MKEYPSISGNIVKNQPIYAFDKLDGSNVRAEWSKKKGLHKFGTRRRLLGEDETILGRAPALIREKYEDDLELIFKENRWKKVVCFFEFHGPNSFAGTHRYDEIQTVTLFDAAPDNKGLLEPREYLKVFGHLDIAPLLYKGKANSEFVQSVKGGTLDGMTFEGVICKGKYKSPGLPLMFKVKSVAWIQTLREKYKENREKFEELL